MKKNLSHLIELSYDDTFKTLITLDQVIKAKEQINIIPQNNEELFQVVLSLNLINAALKMKEYKSKEKNAIIHYGMLKPKVSKLLNYMLEIDTLEFNCDFYIDAANHCAYIEIAKLQFSFHNITITNKIQTFIDSKKNQPKEWKGIRLQKIAGELFDNFNNKKGAVL